MPALYLSLGSNLGDRHALLLRAIDLLSRQVGRLVRASSFIQTEPWGYTSPHLYLNAAVLLHTTLTPHEALAATQAIERHLGRTTKPPAVSPSSSLSSPHLSSSSAAVASPFGEVPSFSAASPSSPSAAEPSSFGEDSLPAVLPPYSDRPIDIDILLYDDLRLSTPELTIPHPRMLQRDFVLRPLREILRSLPPGTPIPSTLPPAILSS